MSKRYLKKWICPNNHENWAYEFKCTHAGCEAPRKKGVEWFLPKPLVEATDEEWKLKGSGPNWFCNYCGCENPVYNETNCGYCGAPIGKVKTTIAGGKVDLERESGRKSEAKAYLTDDVDHGDVGWGYPVVEAVVKSLREEGIGDETPRLSSRTVFSVPDTWESQGERKNTKTKKMMTVGVGVFLFLLVGWLVWHFFLETETYSAWVTGYQWEQILKIEELKTLNQVDWKSEMPADAYNVSCAVVLKGWTKVPDGTKEVEVLSTCEKEQEVCRDDGAGGVNCETEKTSVSCTKKESVTKYKDVPVYEDKCIYNIDRWMEIQSYPTNGNDHFPKYHTDFVITDPSHYRAVEVPGSYTVYFESEMVQPFNFKYDLGTWLLFEDEPGQVVEIEINRQDKVLWKPKP